MADYTPNDPTGGVIPDWARLASMFSANGAQNPGVAGASPSLFGSNSGFGSGLGLGSGFGMNIGTGQLALGGLNALGGLWTAWNATKLANEQFDFTKGITNTNLNNSIKSYNTALSDKANARYFTEGLPSSDAASYIAANKLTR